MFNTPAGLTSSVKADNKTFILQTEFLAAAKNQKEAGGRQGSGARIVTTVAVGGQIVHRVEKVMPSPIDTPELFSQAEKFVKKQHISVARVIASRPREFIASATDIKVSPADRLRVIPGVAEVVEINRDLSHRSQQDPGFQYPVIENLEKIRDLVISISQNTRLGKLQKIVGTIEDRKFLLTGCGGKFYLLNLKNDVDITKILNELEIAKI